ncbi:hypothetical protein [Pseudonocardia kunmingensis]|uniref:hypothetical protein n=1 Tax=Pseudonocardia kunmingensis TaxID=630975 RepID=UPI001FEC6713|nr:hypothetical protein [Pseudonocardia kunmingensis]
MNTPAEALPTAIADLERMREAAGREDRIAITVDGRVGDLEDLDLLRRLDEMGVDRVICRPWRSSRDALDGMTRYTEEVLRKL